MLSMIGQNSSKSPLAAGTGSRPTLAHGAVVSGWRSQSELAAQHPDAMSHTTARKVLTDRQQGCEGGEVEEEKGERRRQHLVQNCVPSSGLKATARNTRPPPACTGGPKQHGNTTRQHVIFNNHCTVRLGFVQKKKKTL